MNAYNYLQSNKNGKDFALLKISSVLWFTIDKHFHNQIQVNFPSEYTRRGIRPCFLDRTQISEVCNFQIFRNSFKVQHRDQKL